MKTNDELETLIQNLIARMNRVEAKQAYEAQPMASTDTVCDAVDKAVDMLERAIEQHQLHTHGTLSIPAAKEMAFLAVKTRMFRRGY